jgi:hypothetical protein
LFRIRQLTSASAQSNCHPSPNPKRWDHDRQCSADDHRCFVAAVPAR